MALHRSGSSRTSRHDPDKDDDDMDNNGYMQLFLKPIEQGDYSAVLAWLGLPTTSKQQLTGQQVAMLSLTGAGILSLFIYQLLVADIGSLFYALAALITPVFAIAFTFFWVSLYLRHSWNTTSVYILFAACFFGEFLGQCLVRETASGPEGSDGNESCIARPLLAFIFLLSVSAASLVSSLETSSSSAVIIFLSIIRFLAATTLEGLPPSVRPFIAYLSGLTGVIGAKYMETLFKPPVTNLVAPEGKIPVIKRRRSSASTMHGFSNTHRSGRRTSLPALIHSKSQNGRPDHIERLNSKSATASYEAAIISEAHGLINDMLADSNLPPHVVSGLKSVSNLLKPPDTHIAMHKPKVSPLVSLSETSNFGSDSEDSPYTGERPSSLPKRLRRSLPPSLIRRMSTSTWTTTTSATGMPTLEPEPCRTRSSSFRHSRDNTPGSSPAGSRSNSPSPSSPTVSLTIPKSRSFSMASTTNSNTQKRLPRERRSLQHLPSSTSPSDHILTKASDTAGMTEEELKAHNVPSLIGPSKDKIPTTLSRRLNITSDYESSDSPGSSDHSDNVTSTEDCRTGSRSPVMKITPPTNLPPTSMFDTTEYVASSKQQYQEENQTDKDQGESCTDSGTLKDSSSSQSRYSKFALDQRSGEARSWRNEITSKFGIERNYEPSQTTDSIPFDEDDVQNNALLSMHMLNQWDYPIFELADTCPSSILSQISYKIFLETGLFETFRIPLPEFLHYFHALELGYREKPYHNRVHATDVLHGVYYLTTQPIPGFEQVNPEETDFLNKQGSSSESDSEMSEKAVCHRPSFTAEDTYGIMGGNFPPLELMALYTAAAMHDYDHPGRTNAFLVTTHSSLAVLYNDRSVLESHHAASAWELLLSNPAWNWLCHLEKGEFKRFRFLVIEAILATDLKRHFEMVAEFNAKANDEDAAGVDWTNETDRLQVASMVIKLADINGPTKRKDLHVAWTDRITEEFYEQGDEEAAMGLPISPYMDRKNPQLAKLQESFINHLVAPLCNAVGAAGLLPGTWEEDTTEDSDKGESSSAYKDTDDDDDTESEPNSPRSACKKNSNKRIHCWLTKNLEDNHAMWVVVLNKEAAAKEAACVNPATTTCTATSSSTSIKDSDSNSYLEPIQLAPRSMSVGDKEMEAIKEEETPPNSANSVKDDDHRRASLPVIRHTAPTVTFAQPAVTQPCLREVSTRPTSSSSSLSSSLKKKRSDRQYSEDQSDRAKSLASTSDMREEGEEQHLRSSEQEQRKVRKVREKDTALHEESR